MNVMVDEPANSLSGGIVVSSSYQSLEPRKSSPKLAVRIINHSKRGISIPMKSVIGEIHQVSLLPCDSCDSDDTGS